MKSDLRSRQRISAKIWRGRQLSKLQEKLSWRSGSCSISTWLLPAKMSSSGTKATFSSQHRRSRRPKSVKCPSVSGCLLNEGKLQLVLKLSLDARNRVQDPQAVGTLSRVQVRCSPSCRRPNVISSDGFGLHSERCPATEKERGFCCDLRCLCALQSRRALGNAAPQLSCSACRWRPRLEV